ncbi:MAG: carbohydrate ABC transporter permease [Planctomycetaceae bacterium]|nr:carbohydrate ABC transporter permease [Planctomycetaceae bacterium]
MIARTTGEKIFGAFNVVILAAFAFVSLYPFLYTFAISVSSSAESQRAGLHVVPGDLSLLARGMADLVGLGAGSKLRDEDILDLPRFTKALAESPKAEKANVSRRMWSGFSTSLQDTIRRSAAGDTKVDRASLRSGLVAQINAMLEQADFFDAAAWSASGVDAKTLAMLSAATAQGESANDVIFLNRERLNAAYPELIAPHLRGRYWQQYARGLSKASYIMVFRNNEILWAYLVTIARTVIGTVLTVLATALAAYPLSRSNMPWRKSLTFFILFTMIFSGGLVPMYMLIKSVGLMDNFMVYIIPGLLGAFNIIVVKNFFQSIPESLAESARIDGASELGVLMRVYIPLSKPVLATVALWTAVGHWNAWFDGMLYVFSNKLQILQILLRRIVIENSTQLIEKGLINPDQLSFAPDTIKAATVIVTILPVLLVYPFLQKYFVKGIMLGGVKE